MKSIRTDICQDTSNREPLTSSCSHSGLIPASESEMLAMFADSNLFLVFSRLGVRFFARLRCRNNRLFESAETKKKSFIFR